MLSFEANHVSGELSRPLEKFLAPVRRDFVFSVAPPPGVAFRPVIGRFIRPRRRHNRDDFTKAPPGTYTGQANSANRSTDATGRERILWLVTLQPAMFKSQLEVLACLLAEASASAVAKGFAFGTGLLAGSLMTLLQNHSAWGLCPSLRAAFVCEYFVTVFPKVRVPSAFRAATRQPDVRER